MTTLASTDSFRMYFEDWKFNKKASRLYMKYIENILGVANGRKVFHTNFDIINPRNKPTVTEHDPDLNFLKKVEVLAGQANESTSALMYFRYRILLRYCDLRHKELHLRGDQYYWEQESDNRLKEAIGTLAQRELDAEKQMESRITNYSSAQITVLDAVVSPIQEQAQCTCPIQTLMVAGCQCGNK